MDTLLFIDILKSMSSDYTERCAEGFKPEEKVYELKFKNSIRFYWSSLEIHIDEFEYGEKHNSVGIYYRGEYLGEIDLNYVVEISKLRYRSVTVLEEKPNRYFLDFNVVDKIKEFFVD